MQVCNHIASGCFVICQKCRIPFQLCFIRLISYHILGRLYSWADRLYTVQSLLNHKDLSVLVKLQLVHTHGSKIPGTRDCFIMIEQIPFSLVLHYRTVRSVTAGGIQEYILILPWAKRTVAGSIFHTVSVSAVVIRICKIINSVSLKDPGTLMEIIQSLHGNRLRFNGYHIII